MTSQYDMDSSHVINVIADFMSYHNVTYEEVLEMFNDYL